MVVVVVVIVLSVDLIVVAGVIVVVYDDVDVDFFSGLLGLSLLKWIENVQS